ncbi:MAG: hypothetical protein Q9208_002820 [Pyrenodesmia sp. 3 TL-2023]
MGEFIERSGRLDRARIYEIHEKEDFFVGRWSPSWYHWQPQFICPTDAASHIHLQNPTISNVHLRIYSIRYDPDIEPFVYAENLSNNGVEWLSVVDTSWVATSIQKNKAVLLSDGDRLRFCDQTTFTFETRLPASQLLTSTQQRENEDPDCHQVLEKAVSLQDRLRRTAAKALPQAFSNLIATTDRKLGSGISGRVFMVFDRFWRRQMACKIVQLRKCHEDRSDVNQGNGLLVMPGTIGNKRRSNNIWKEVDLLRGLSHPNIIRIDRVFYTEFNIYIIEELITGGDLMSYIERNDWRVDAEESCLIIYQILQAVSYLHQKGITHRDLKPENILMSSTAAGARVIVTDFGGSTKTTGGGKGCSSRMQTMTGTAHYEAPEIRGKNSLVQEPGYTNAVDMWSIGCVTAAMLIGRPPFALSQASTSRQDSAARVIAAAAKCDLRVLDRPEVWGDIDVQAKTFIKRLLVLDERARLSARQALEHDWFTQERHKNSIATRYNQAIAGWTPSYLGWDFKEHLDRFIEARIPESDMHNRVLSTSALVVGLLAGSSRAYWRLSCSTIQTSRIDPIINPNALSPHAHIIAGAANINQASTYDSLIQSNCTSCEIQDDKSAYWTPLLYYQHSNGSFEEVPHGGMTVYYLGRGDDKNIQPFPPGFRMVSGKASARSYDQNTLIPGTKRPVADRVSFACLDYSSSSKEQPGMVSTDCKNGLRAQVHFQSCWNGKDLYKTDNSHVEYMSLLDNGVCPSTHPVALMHLFFEVLYSVNDIKKDGGKFVFSHGDTTGFGFHGDFLNGWKPDVLQSAIKECGFTNDAGVQYCAPFKPSLDPDFSKSCPERPSLLNEPVHGMIDELPGCVTITSGPQDATIAEMTCAGGQSSVKEVSPLNSPVDADSSAIPSVTTLQKVSSVKKTGVEGSTATTSASVKATQYSLDDSVEVAPATETLASTKATSSSVNDDEQEGDNTLSRRDLVKGPPLVHNEYGYSNNFPPTTTHHRPGPPNGSPAPHNRHNRRAVSHKAGEGDPYSYSYDYPPQGSPAPHQHKKQHNEHHAPLNKHQPES